MQSLSSSLSCLRIFSSVLPRTRRRNWFALSHLAAYDHLRGCSLRVILTEVVDSVVAVLARELSIGVLLEAEDSAVRLADIGRTGR